MKVSVHPRIHERHPDVTDEGVYSAWISCVKSSIRPDTRDLIGLGYDLRGRMLEFIAHHGDTDTWVIYHAMKCTKKTLRELGLQSPRNPRSAQ